MAEVGSAFVSILPSARGFGSQLDRQVGGEVGGAGKRIGSKFGTALKVGAAAALGAAGVAAVFLKGALDEAREAQKVGAQTNAVIKSTGGVANVTAKQVGNLASAISRKSGIDDEAIQSASNLLLTFTNVRNEVGKGNDIFNQATQTVTDMGVALGTEPKAAAIQLGKALNDPIKGITALTRVGVSFTEQQKEQITTLVESGKTVQAQKIILGELNKEFGGSAAAAATAGDKFKVAFGNLQESVGTAILPVVDRVLNGLTTLVNFAADRVGPAIGKVTDAFGFLFQKGFLPVEERARGFGEILDNLLGNTGALVGPIAAVGKVLFDVAHGFEAFKAGASGFTGDSGIVGFFERFGAAAAKIGPQLVAAFRVAVPQIVSIASAVGTQLARIASAIVPQVSAIVAAVLPKLAAFAATVGPQIVTTVNMIGSAAVSLVNAFAPFVRAVLPSLIEAGTKIAAAILPALQSVVGAIQTQLVPAFQRIMPILIPVVQFLIGVFGSAVVGAIQGVAQTIKGVVTVIAGVINTIVALLHGDWAAAWAGVKQIVVGALTAVLGAVKAYLNIGVLNIFRRSVFAMKGLWTGLWSGLKGVAEKGAAGLKAVFTAVFGFLRTLISRTVGVYVALWRSLFTILKAAATGDWGQIRNIFSSALSAINGIVGGQLNAIKGLFTAAWNAIKGAVSSAFGAIKNAVSNGIGGVVGLVKSIPGRVVSALGNLGSVLYNAGASLIQGLINGIMSKIDDVANAIGSVAGKVKGFFPGSPVKEGPLRAWNKTGKTGPGGQLVGRLAKGLSNTGPVKKAADHLAGTVAGSFSGAHAPERSKKDVEKANERHQKAVEKKIDGTNKELEKHTDRLKEIRDKTRDLQNTVASNFRSDTFGQNFTLQGALTSLRMDTKNANQFRHQVHRAKKLGLDGGVLKAILESGNTALLRDLDNRGDVKKLEHAWRQRNKATSNMAFGFFGGHAAVEKQQKTIEELRGEIHDLNGVLKHLKHDVRDGAREGTDNKSRRERGHRKSHARKATAP